MKLCNKENESSSKDLLVLGYFGWTNQESVDLGLLVGTCLPRLLFQVCVEMRGVMESNRNGQFPRSLQMHSSVRIRVTLLFALRMVCSVGFGVALLTCCCRGAREQLWTSKGRFSTEWCVIEREAFDGGLMCYRLEHGGSEYRWLCLLHSL
jgi:hypothetical protein